MARHKQLGEAGSGWEVWTRAAAGRPITRYQAYPLLEAASAAAQALANSCFAYAEVRGYRGEPVASYSPGALSGCPVENYEVLARFGRCVKKCRRQVPTKLGPCIDKCQESGGQVGGGCENPETGKVHYWTGRGTLCSLDNSVEQKANHTSDQSKVTCMYCLGQIERNRKQDAGWEKGGQVGGLFDQATNMFGPLSPNVRARLQRYFATPSERNWNDVYGIEVNAGASRDRPRTVWQAVIAVDPSFPRVGPSTGGHWKRWPDKWTFALAIKQATSAPSGPSGRSAKVVPLRGVLGGARYVLPDVE